MFDLASDTHPLRRLAAFFITSTLAIFAAGAAVGVFAVGLNRGFPLSNAALIAGFLALAVIASWLSWRLKRADLSGPMAANEKVSRNLVLASGTIGGLLGLMIAIGGIQKDDPLYLFGNGPLEPALGGIFLAVWLVIVPVISFLWWRVINEHEARSYSFGGMAALNVYYFVTLGWWIGWRSGFVPEPQHMAIYLVVTGVWIVGWMWRRYR